jgi:predicted NAD-dependent protein-ADP-ribosyltransferase YbiA (DUF1768 family)
MSVDVFMGSWTRDQVAKDTSKVYLFGDNIEDLKNGYVPSSTQAVIRGLPNAIGIPTKKKRGTTDDCYFWDNDPDYKLFVAGVNAAIDKALASGKAIVVPAGGIGTGKAAVKGAFADGSRFKVYLDRKLAQLKSLEEEISMSKAGRIRIVNMHNYKAKPLEEILIKVDRTTIIGNPFFMQYEEQRDEVCNKYEVYFEKQMKVNPKFKSEVDAIVEHVRRGDNVALGCWCAPKRCHAETIVRYVEDQLSRVPVAYPPRSTWEPKKEEVKAPNVICYAGIGSRETPDDIFAKFSTLAGRLAKLGFVLRSGGAEGADTAFQLGCAAQLGKMDIYLPWPGFNNNTSNLYNITPEAMAMAAKFHPAWANLSDGAKKLQARNCYQVLGYNLKSPSTFVVCYTKGGKGEGGTGQAIRIAKHYNIPVFDFGALGAEDKLNAFIDSLVAPVSVIPKAPASEVSFRGDRYYLSNFYPCSVTIGTRTYDNAEAAFQSYKNDTDKDKFLGLKGQEAKSLGMRVKLKLSKAEWNKYRLVAMEEVLIAKFTQHPDLAKKLKAEVGLIAENNTWGDDYWGTVNGIGENHLGIILMKIRDHLIAIDDNHDEEDDRVSDEDKYSPEEKLAIERLMLDLNQSGLHIMSTYDTKEWGMRDLGYCRIPYIEKSIQVEDDEYFYCQYSMERIEFNHVHRTCKKGKISRETAVALVLDGLRQ